MTKVILLSYVIYHPTLTKLYYMQQKIKLIYDAGQIIKFAEKLIKTAIKNQDQPIENYVNLFHTSDTTRS